MSDDAPQHEDFVDAPSTTRKRERGKNAKIDREAALAEMLGTKQGRALLSWILHDLCGLYAPTANAAFDANGQHFREGARAVGLMLHQAALDVAPDQYLVLISENLRKQ